GPGAALGRGGGRSQGGSWLLLRSDVLDGALVVARAEPGDDSLGPAGVLRRRRDEDGVPEGDREVAPVGQRGVGVPRVVAEVREVGLDEDPTARREIAGDAVALRLRGLAEDLGELVIVVAHAAAFLSFSRRVRYSARVSTFWSRGDFHEPPSTLHRRRKAYSGPPISLM